MYLIETDFVSVESTKAIIDIATDVSLNVISNSWTNTQFDDWRIWAFIESRLSFQLFNVKSHSEHVMKFLMSDSKQNSTTTRISETELIWNHFLNVVRRSSYVKIITIMTIWCYDDMLIWNLRRIDNLIELINSIVVVERNEIDWQRNRIWKIWEIWALLALKICDVSDRWLTERRTWRNASKEYIIVLKAAEKKFRFVW